MNSAFIISGSILTANGNIISRPTAILNQDIPTSQVGFPFTLTISFSSVGVPTGQVVFYDGSSLLETVPLVNGVAVWSVSSLTVGYHSLQARYLGDASHLAVQSNIVNHLIVARIATSRMLYVDTCNSTIVIGGTDVCFGQL